MIKSDTAEPETSPVLYHAFFFLLKTWCLHCPECNAATEWHHWRKQLQNFPFKKTSKIKEKVTLYWTGISSSRNDDRQTFFLGKLPDSQNKDKKIWRVISHPQLQQYNGGYYCKQVKMPLVGTTHPSTVTPPAVVFCITRNACMRWLLNLWLANVSDFSHHLL